jgi:beta-galactosidase
VADDALLQAHHRLHPQGRPRRDDLQERLHQRKRGRALDDGAGPAARSAGLPLPGILQPGPATRAEGRPVPGRRRQQGAHWAEFLQLDTAKALAWYDHPFFGRWPAITANQYGAGKVVYEGTYLSDKLQKSVLQSCCRKKA